MALFNINGRDADTLEEAVGLCRLVWTEAKAPAVEAQRRDALSKITSLDIERAKAGVVVDASSQV